MSRTDYVYVDVEIRKVSQRAILVKPSDGGEEAWIPRSVIEDGEIYLESSVGTRSMPLGIEEWKVDELGW